MGFRIGAYGARVWLLLTGLLLVSGSGARAQHLPLRGYSTADGLAHNDIRHITRDSRGFLWFCTADGLCRFDGYDFRTYGPADGLPGPAVNTLLEARDGTYWIGTSGGLARLKPGSATAREGDEDPRSFVEIPSDDPHPRARTIATLFEDSRGTIWCGTGAGLFRVVRSPQGDRLRHVDLPLPPNAYPEQEFIGAIVEDADRSLWIASPSGLYHRRPDGRAARYTVADGLPDTYLHDLLRDHQGRLWAATRYAGFFRFAGTNGGAPAVLEWHAKANGLPTDWVFSLFETTDDRFWLGTNIGAIEFVEHASDAAQRFQLVAASQGLGFPEAAAFAEDAGHNLWIGTNRIGAFKLARDGLVTYSGPGRAITIGGIVEEPGGGLALRASVQGAGANTFARFDGQRIRWCPPPGVRLGWVLEGITVRAHDGEWWLGTGDGIFRYPAAADVSHLVSPIAHYTRRDGLAGSQVFGLFEDSTGDVWASTMAPGITGLARWHRATGTWTNLAGAPGLPSFLDDFARVFAETPDGSVWIGFNHGLARYRDGRFTFFGARDGLPDGAIMDLLADRGGRLWATSAHWGLVRVDDPARARPVWRRYTTAQGLSSDYTGVLVDDLRGRIYIATGRAVDRLDPATGRIDHFTKADGLGAGAIHDGIRDHRGVIWFGTDNGISRLVPQPPARTAPPPVLITRLVVNGVTQGISPVGERAVNLPELAPGRNQIEIGFVGLDFATGEKLRYQYRVGGGGQAWSAPSERRSVDLASLTAGRYRFEVRAVRPDGSMSPSPAAIDFVIPAPVWRRWWFVLTIALAAAAALHAAYRYRLRRLMEIAAIRSRIAADLHDDIGANLTRIAILSEVARHQLSGAERADALLTSVAQISRESVASLSDIVWAVSPDRDRLTDLVRRMRRHAEEALTTQGIDLSFHAPEDGRNLKLAPDVRRGIFLMFKEVVNNAARHARCSRVTVVLQAEGAVLSLEVADDGAGFDASSLTDGDGLTNITRRAEALGGSCVVSSAPGRGTIVRIVVPTGGTRRRRGLPQRVGDTASVSR